MREGRLGTIDVIIVAKRLRFVGGMRGPYGASATWPLAVLSIDDDFGVTVSARGIFGRLPGLEPMRYSWDNLECAEEVKSMITGYPGVRIVGSKLPRVVFWTRRSRAILTALAERGAHIRDEGDAPTVRIWP